MVLLLIYSHCVTLLLLLLLVQVVCRVCVRLWHSMG
jgi:hypothetical protein